MSNWGSLGGGVVRMAQLLFLVLGYYGAERNGCTRMAGKWISKFQLLKISPGDIFMGVRSNFQYFSNFSDRRVLRHVVLPGHAHMSIYQPLWHKIFIFSQTVNPFYISGLLLFKAYQFLSPRYLKKVIQKTNFAGNIPCTIQCKEGGL